ncbi:arylacetamide deacetylase-like [Physella acuta]|uniref:arylacetamide deacetylase-like n=1 Tax=Physella acuta TaxID=109671 RepID=UPI0027DAEC4E|nr:arylacetamide deacetylase-like [Physella acuta]XP_059155780.1 arylacetamide deacetylase-like [Physella acuta]
MLLRLLLIVLTVLVVAIAIIGYTPMPDGLQDPHKTQILMGVMKIMFFVMNLKQIFGYESWHNNLRNFQGEITLEGDLPSAKYGDVKVTRDRVANVPVIVYRPHTAEELSPALIFFHGGGWVLGTADEWDLNAYHYAKEANIIVINVDYRRAPVYPFPIPAQDCLEVTQYVLRHGKTFGIDVNKVGVGGDSAGGNLAAVVALTLAKEESDLPPLKYQVLSYPALQALDFRLPAYVDNSNTMPILTAKSMAVFYVLYLGLDDKNAEHYAKILMENRHISPEFKKSKYSEYVDVEFLPKMFRTPNKTAPVVTEPYDPQVAAKVEPIIVNPLFSPLMAPDLSGLPPAYVHACEFDVLRDDALLYARRLLDAGVMVKTHIGYGGYHADTVKMIPEILQSQSGKTAFTLACDFIKSMVKN